MSSTRRLYVEECAQIRAEPKLLRAVFDCPDVQRGPLVPDAPASPAAELEVTWPDGSHTTVRVRPTKTAQFRGHRWWFLCPTCKHRCARLYSPSPSVPFACRKCHSLVYRSQYESQLVRTLRALGLIWKRPRKSEHQSH